MVSAGIKKYLRYAAWAVIVILVVASIAIVVTRAGVDQALVKQQLDQFAADLKQRGHDTGRIVELTYGDIEMAGGIGDRHAIVHNPKLLVKPLPDRAPPPVAGKPNSLLVTTAELDIVPTSSDMSSMKLSLPQPLDVSSEEEPTKSLLKITTNAPFELLVEQKHRDNSAYLHIRQELPTETKFSYLREQVAQGEEDKTPTIVPVYETLILKLDKGVSDVTYALDNSHLGDGSVDYQNVSIMPEKMPDAAIKISNITGKWNAARGGNNTVDSSSSLHIDAITAPKEILPYAPVSLNYDFAYQGVLPMIMGGTMPTQPTPTKLQLKDFALHTKDANLDAKADFTVNPQELLPLGHAHVKLTNVPYVESELKSMHVLSPDGANVMHDMIAHIAGQPYAQVKDFEFDITRAEGGASQIGHATFEDLFALFLKNKLQQQAQPSVMEEAPAKPEVAPHGSK